ncbi:MAG: hypothetical protein J7M14_01830 [Planctomycetes bacterium]|nr:hypothetical protein [Planctomycetota bacterium]
MTELMEWESLDSGAGHWTRVAMKKLSQPRFDRDEARRIIAESKLEISQRHDRDLLRRALHDAPGRCFARLTDLFPCLVELTDNTQSRSRISRIRITI